MILRKNNWEWSWKCALGKWSLGSLGHPDDWDPCQFSHLNSTSLVAQTVKNLPAMQEIQVRSLGWEDPLEKGMATGSTLVLLPGEFNG